MARGTELTEAQWDELDRLRFSTTSAKVFRNCLIILKSSLGESRASIAEELGCGTDTVARARRQHRRGGARALIPKKPTGRKSRATPDFIAQMKEAVRTSPLRLGYGFSTWSAARLAAHLAKTTRIRFSEDQMIRLLHDHGFSVHRPKHTLKGRRDEAAYQKAKAELAVLKKTPWPKTPPKR